MVNQVEFLNGMEPCTDFKVKYGDTKNRARKEADGQFFVYAKGKRRWGHRYDSAERLLANGYVPIIDKVSQTEKWHGRIRRVLSEIDRTGLWKGTSLETELRNMMKMTFEDREEMKRLFWESRYENGVHIQNPELTRFIDKYPFAFGIDDLLKTAYIFEPSECIVKSVYFGKHVTEQIRRNIATAIELGVDYSSGRIHGNYDYTFELRKDEDGLRRAWYSQEYKGCGNGHYYVALSENTALFVEND